MLSKPSKSKSKQAFNTNVKIPIPNDPLFKRHKSQESYPEVIETISKKTKAKRINKIPQVITTPVSKPQNGIGLSYKISPLKLDQPKHKRPSPHKYINDFLIENNTYDSMGSLSNSNTSSNGPNAINGQPHPIINPNSALFTDFYTNSIEEGCAAYYSNEREGDEGIINALPKPFVKQSSLKENNSSKVNEEFAKKELIQKYNRKLFIYSKKGDRNGFLKYLSLLSTLLNKNININHKDDQGYSFIHYASYEGNLKIVEILIELNANLNAKTANQKTPLLLSVEKGFFDITRILIENGAIMSCCDDEKNTPLHLCALNGHVELLKFLLEKNPEADCKNIYNKTPLNVAKNDKIREILKDYLSKTTFHYHKVTIFETKNKVANNMLKGTYHHQQKKSVNSKQGIQQQSTVIQQPNQGNSNKQQPMISNIIEIIKLQGKKKKKTQQKTCNTRNNAITNANSYGNSNGNGSQKKEDNRYMQTCPALYKIQQQLPNEEAIGPDDFSCYLLLGKGSFGEVFLVQKKDNKLFYAMKVLSKETVITQNIVKYAMAERNVLSLTNHPFIVKLCYSFQTKQKLFLILDYCPGGNLADHLLKERKFNESRVKIYLCEIILAIEDLHKRNIIFRDLKPDNVVLDKDGHALLTDFGLSKEGVLDNSCAQSFCGSMAYLAPEMIKKEGHGKSVDWYLLGVLFYEMIVGMPPYYNNNKEQLFSNIQHGQLSYPEYISKEGVDLLRGLLNRDPLKRLGAGKGDYEEIKSHVYFRDVNWEDVYNRKLHPPKPVINETIVDNVIPQDFPYNYYHSNDNSSNSKTVDNELMNHFQGWSFINKTKAHTDTDNDTDNIKKSNGNINSHFSM